MNAELHEFMKNNCLDKFDDLADTMLMILQELNL